MRTHSTSVPVALFLSTFAASIVFGEHLSRCSCFVYDIRTFSVRLFVSNFLLIGYRSGEIWWPINKWPESFNGVTLKTAHIAYVEYHGDYESVWAIRMHILVLQVDETLQVRVFNTAERKRERKTLFFYNSSNLATIKPAQHIR